MFRDRILPDQGIVALQIQSGVPQQCLILCQLGLGLLQSHLVGPRIDLGEKVALLHQLAFGESDLGQLTVDLGLHRHRSERRHGAELIEDHANIA